MLNRLHRFHGHNSLRFVYQRGRAVRGQLLSLKYIRNERRSTYRCAVVVSKKVSKSAVVRNRIRRRLYEQIRLQADHIQGAYDMVIIVYHEQVASLPNDQLQAVVVDQLHEARIIKKAPSPIRKHSEPTAK